MNVIQAIVPKIPTVTSIPQVPATVQFQINGVVFTIVALALCFVVVNIIHKILTASVQGAQTRRLIPEAFVGKTNTLNSILFNLIDVALFGVTILIILSHWKIDIAPILTGAGIFGLAISFGSQTLVKDIISGFFIISESQYNIGDRVKIGTYEGRVYKVTLRLTVLKDDEGNKIYIPNSTITTVTRVKVVKKSEIIKNPKTSLKKKREPQSEIIIPRGYHA
jgi:small conductance mechanosensitive channel